MFDGFDYSNVDPALAQELMGLGTIDEKQEQLQQQLALAQAIAAQRGPHRSTAGGAIAQGIGDLLGGLIAGQKAGGFRGEIAGLTDKREGLRKKYSAEISRQLEEQKAQAEALRKQQEMRITPAPLVYGPVQE